MWYIKQPNEDLFIRTEIDSSGMDIFWMGILDADVFDTQAAAEQFVARIKERRPSEPMEVIFVA